MTTTTATRAEAKADVKAAAKAGKQSPLKSKKAIIMIVLLLAVAGGAYKFVLAPKPKPGPAVGGDVVTLDANTVNLAGGHYLKIAVAVQLIKGKGTVEEFTTSEAEELVIDEFSNLSVAAVSSSAKVDRLMSDLETKMKKAYPDEVFKIFRTQFVTQ